MKKLVFLFAVLLTSFAWSQDRPDPSIQKMNYGDFEIQELLRDKRLSVCLYEYYDNNEVGNHKVLKKVLDGDIVVSTYYRIRGVNYYRSNAFNKYHVDLVIRRDVLKENGKEIVLKCTVNK